MCSAQHGHTHRSLQIRMLLIRDLQKLCAIDSLPSRKSEKNVPWIDCFTAPCKGGCPIAQDNTRRCAGRAGA